MAKTESTIRDQAYQFFEHEALELLQVLEDGLLRLRSELELPQVHELMRAAHSIKGGAASVGLPGIQKIAHKLEDILRALYRRTEPIDTDLEGALLLAYDCLRLPLQTQIEQGHYDEASAWETAEPVFSVLEALLGDDLGADIELPTSAELGIDIVTVVFTGDVQHSIDRLELVLQDPEAQPLAGEIRATVEVLSGIGEILGLPGLGAIAQAVAQALEANPSEALIIGQLTLDCMRQAQAEVLGGDRIQGGRPSDALLSLTQPIVPSTLASAEASHPESKTTSYGNLEDFLASEAGAPDPEAISASVYDGLENLLVSEPEAPTEPISAYSDLEFFGMPDSVMEGAVEPLTDHAEPYGNLETFFDAGFDAAVLPSELDVLDHTSASSSDSLSLEELVQPTAPDTLVTPPSPAIAQRPLAPKAAPLNAAPMEGSVRVDFLRLERLNNLVGELVTQENGALLQNQQLQGKLKGLQQRFVTFEQLSKNLQTWMDQSLQAGIGGQHLKSSGAVPSRNSEITDLSDFDPLQMDSYSILYTMMQETLEEIAQMGETVRDMTAITQQTQNNQRKKQQTLKQVRNDLLWARMMPLGDILRRFPRMVRDLAAQHDKQVSLRLVGENTLVDRTILERLYDPLVHLVRNAFDHGTEPSRQRLAQGKPPEATIEIRAYHRGNQTFIEVKDDGRGIDPEKVRVAALEQGILTPEAAAAATPEQLYQCLFASSFSTTDQVSDLSGRGMGLTAVKTQVETLKGKISITSEPGKGTTFVLALPLTLTIAKLLLFSIDSRDWVIPINTLVGIIAAEAAHFTTHEGRSYYRHQDQRIPLYAAAQFARHYPLPKGFAQRRVAMPLNTSGKPSLLLVGTGENAIALEVDQVFDEQELVIKPFGQAVTAPAYLYGCAILGDGSLAPVVDGAELRQQWLATQNTLTASEPAVIHPESTSVDQQIATILVVDDSLTTRQNLTLTLQKFGYQVIQAGDGREALEKLRQNSDIKAVFCDVEMPVMNGFEFLNASRKDYPATVLPIMMVTSRGGEKHRGIAKLLGANAYLTKPYLEQELKQVLKENLEQSVG